METKRNGKLMVATTNHENSSYSDMEDQKPGIIPFSIASNKTTAKE